MSDIKQNHVKSSYVIPFTLNNSRGDAVFIIAKHAVTIRFITFVLVLAGVDFFLKKNIPLLSHGGFLGPLVVLIGLDVLAWLLFANRIKTGLTGWRMFNIARTHLTKFQNQTVNMDKSALLSDVLDYLPFKDIDPITGEIIFNNNDKGMLFNIIGYASKNMFDGGKISSVGDFETALRTMDASSTQYYMTIVSGQNVNIQVKMLLKKYKKEKNPEVRKYIKQSIEKLTNYVDGQFSTLHQYLLIRYPNEEGKDNSIRWLENIIKSDTSVLKFISPLSYTDVIKTFQIVFTPSKDTLVTVDLETEDEN